MRSMWRRSRRQQVQKSGAPVILLDVKSGSWLTS